MGCGSKFSALQDLAVVIDFFVKGIAALVDYGTAKRVIMGSNQLEALGVGLGMRLHP